MSHSSNIKTKQKVYGMSGCEMEGKEWAAGEMPDEEPERRRKKRKDDDEIAPLEGTVQA